MPPWVGLYKGGWDSRTKMPRPACNTLSAISSLFRSGSCGLRQGSLLLTEAVGTGGSYKAKQVEGLPKDLIKCSIFKKQLLICIVMPHPFPLSLLKKPDVVLLDF